MLYEELTGGIISAFYTVYNALGYGFLEKVYEHALAIELRRQGFEVVQQMRIEVYYEDHCVGVYYADLVVNYTIVIEIKAAQALHPRHALQLVNYLRATDMEVGLLLNFGAIPQVAQKIFTNDRKKPHINPSNP